MSIKKYLPKSQYTFSVSATLEYNVEATSEEEAHRKLIKQYGAEISHDDVIVTREEIELADCINEIDLDDN